MFVSTITSVESVSITVTTVLLSGYGHHYGKRSAKAQPHEDWDLQEGNDDPHKNTQYIPEAVSEAEAQPKANAYQVNVNRGKRLASAKPGAETQPEAKVTAVSEPNAEAELQSQRSQPSEKKINKRKAKQRIVPLDPLSEVPQPNGFPDGPPPRPSDPIDNLNLEGTSMIFKVHIF